MHNSPSRITSHTIFRFGSSFGPFESLVGNELVVRALCVRLKLESQIAKGK